ncbi:MAG: hypothetical protein FJ039_11205 [Chloroflexi bacterium]|nr:hypothetical protein [Chloroflexota bacterium]
MWKASILRKALLFGTAIAVVGSLIGTTLTAGAQSTTSTPQSNTPTPAPTTAPPTATPAPTRPDRDEMHPRWWAHIFRQAARGDFDKFTGAELRFLTAANERLIVGAHPGTVLRIGDNELQIKPNGGGDPVVYAFRPDADAHLEEFRKHFRNIEIGDRVIIITVNGVAKWVIVVNERKDKEDEREGKRLEQEKERAEKQRELETKKAAQLKEREAKKAEVEAKVKQLQEQARQRAEEARKKAEEHRKNLGNVTSTAASARR